jgi:HEPN domain-containing protein
MTNETSSWYKKAEGDYVTMRREFSALPPNFDAVCFHAQQCIEKLLKALLTEKNIRFPYTHNLPSLVDLLGAIPERLAGSRKDLQVLSEFAVSVRYPLEFAGKPDAQEAMDMCARIRQVLLAELGITELFE